MDGHELLHNFHRRMHRDYALVLTKAGFSQRRQRGFESVHFSDRANIIGQPSATPVIAGALRLTCAAEAIASPAIMSLLRLPGEWRRMLIISPTDGDAASPASCCPVRAAVMGGAAVQSLKTTQVGGWNTHWLDLWRWHHGLGVPRRR